MLSGRKNGALHCSKREASRQRVHKTQTLYSGAGLVVSLLGGNGRETRLRTLRSLRVASVGQYSLHLQLSEMAEDTERSTLIPTDCKADLSLLHFLRYQFREHSALTSGPLVQGHLDDGTACA